MKKISLLLGLAALLMAVTGATVCADEIKVGGGGAPMDNILKPVKGPFEKSTGVKLNLVIGSATLSFKNLYNGDIEASTAGIDFNGLMAALKKEGFEVKDPAAQARQQLEPSGRAMHREQ